MKKTQAMMRIERQYGKPIELLIPQLLEEHGQVEKVSGLLGVSHATFYTWLKYFGFELQSARHITATSKADPKSGL